MAKKVDAKSSTNRSAASAASRGDAMADKSSDKKSTRSATPARKTSTKVTTAKPAATKRKTTKKAATATTKKKKAAPKKAKRTATKKSPRPRSETEDDASISATSQDPIQLPREKPPPKTHLSDSDLLEFKDRLLAKRAELAGDVERLSHEALNNNAHGQGEKGSMPIHMADIGSDNWEQEFTLGLLANERAIVHEIDDALARIQAKTYGVCLFTRKRITRARLRAKPWAKYCIEYARAREEGRAI